MNAPENSEKDIARGSTNLSANPNSSSSKSHKFKVTRNESVNGKNVFTVTSANISPFNAVTEGGARRKSRKSKKSKKSKKAKGKKKGTRRR